MNKNDIFTSKRIWYFHKLFSQLVRITSVVLIVSLTDADSTSFLSNSSNFPISDKCRYAF